MLVGRFWVPLRIRSRFGPDSKDREADQACLEPIWLTCRIFIRKPIHVCAAACDLPKLEK
jgi:hypothetical protein